MKVGERIDPWLNCRFRIEIENLVVGGFAEANGLEVEIDTEEYREGGVNERTHYLPTSLRHSRLMLKRGFIQSQPLWDWLEQTQTGPVERKTVWIFLLNTRGEETASWRCVDAHPVKWSLSELSAERAEILMETLEFVHGGIHRG